MATIRFTVNGRATSVDTEPERLLLEVLREDFGLTGTKYGCGEAQCGACTVLIDDQATLACVTPAGAVQGRKIVTTWKTRASTASPSEPTETCITSKNSGNSANS